MAVHELVKRWAKPWNDAKGETITTGKERADELLEELIRLANTAVDYDTLLEIMQAIVTLYSSKDVRGLERDTDGDSDSPNRSVLNELKIARCPSPRPFRTQVLKNPIGNVPEDQLARVCDVAVLKLLCRCAHSCPEGSTFRSLIWALKYIKLMLGTLSSLKTGWYGAQSRVRKRPTPPDRPSKLNAASLPSEETCSDQNKPSGQEVDYTLDLDKEMSTCVTSEGRISLIVILSAIGALPNKVLDLALPEYVQPILQWCLDLGTTVPATGSKETCTASTEPPKPMNMSEACQAHSQEVVHRVLGIIARYLCRSSCTSLNSGRHCQLQARMSFSRDEAKSTQLQQVTTLREKHLQRIFHNQISHYRKWLVNFVNTKPIGEVFSFLHSTLGYCSPDVSLEEGQSMLNLTASTAAIAFRPVLDRLMHFDLNYTAVESSFLRSNIPEVCQYIHFCQYFQQPKDSPVVESVNQLHRHVQRVALSAVFAATDRNTPPKASVGMHSASEQPVSTESDDNGRHHQIELSSEHRSDDLSKALKDAFSKSESHHTDARTVTSPLSRMTHTQFATTTPQQPGSIMNLWSTSDLEKFHFRLRRLSVLMELSEPGTVPAADMLASLLDFAGKAPVTARAAVFVECAHFVHRLKSGTKTAWVISSVGNHRIVLLNLKKWGEAVGSKLQEILDREKQQNLHREGFDGEREDKTTSFPRQTIEEPVLGADMASQHPNRKQKRMSVSFALKAAACQLLYEISSIMLDPPRVYQSSMPSQLEQTQGPVSYTRSIQRSGVDYDTSQSKNFSFKRRSRMSTTRNQYEDVVRKATIRHTNPHVSVVFSEATPDSNSPSSLPLPMELSAEPDINRSTQKLVKSAQLGNRLTQNFSKLISSMGLRGTQRHTGTIHRKNLGVGGGHHASVSRRKSMYSSAPPPSENIHLPWLECVAELLHPSTICSSSQGTHYLYCLQQRKKQCSQLSLALSSIYQQTPRKSRERTEETIVIKKERKFSRWNTNATQKASDLGSSQRFQDSQNDFTKLLSPPLSVASEDSDSQRKDGLSTPCNGFVSLPLQLEEDALLLSIQQASSLDAAQQKVEFNNSHMQYMDKYMHTLFSPIFLTIMTRTSDLIDSSTLREILWEWLVDTDKELTGLAGALFLLICERSNQADFQSFFNSKVDAGDSSKLAVIRFRSLWNVRYEVFPKIPRDVQRRIRNHELHLGYALPTPLLGNEIKDIPLSPWQPVTLCTGECARDPQKCSLATEFSPVVIHTKDILGLVSDTQVSTIAVSQKASTDSSRLVLSVNEEQQQVDSADRAWQLALFPDSLLPLALHILSAGANRDSSEPTDLPQNATPEPLKIFSKVVEPAKLQVRRQIQGHQCELSTTFAAQEIINSCLVDDHILFFQPFLHLLSQAYQEFSKRTSNTSAKKKKQTSVTCLSIIIEDIDAALHGLRMLVLICPTMPPDAARYLFNHLIGIVMQYSLHNFMEFQKPISDILDILQILSTSVQGLNSKLLKNTLKKESCYPIVMTTARINSLSKAKVFFKKSEKSNPPAFTLNVSGDMTVQDLLVNVHRQLTGSKNSKIEPSSCYVVHMMPKEFEQKKFIPSDSTKLSKKLVLRDNFVARGEPTLFNIEEEDSISQKIFERDQMLYCRMSEIHRVTFARKLLAIGGTEQDAFNFMHTELVEQTSFPRKALDSVYSSPGLVHFRHLRSTDIMLKGSWLQFLCSLFQTSPAFFTWSKDLMLFLSVIGGSLLLHAEEASALRLSLAAFLSIISKFPHVMKDETAELIISTTIQVYAVHNDNELICDSLCHLWGQLHIQRGHEYEFLLQVPSASLALLQEDSSTVPNAVLQQSPGSFVSALLMHKAQVLDTSKESLIAAVFKLLNALASDSPPPDVLGIEELAGVSQISRWQPTSLSKIFNLYVTVVHAGPEKLRGMQTMLFLQHMMPLMVKQLAADYQSIGPFVGGVKNLARACENLISQIHRLRNEAATVGSSRENQGKFMARLQLLKPKRSPRTDQEEQPSVSLTERGVYRRRASILVDSSIRKLRQGSLLSNIQSICATLIALLNVATDIQVASKCRRVGSHHRRESHYDIAVGMDCRTITILSGVVVQAVKHLSYSDADLPPITGFINFTTKFLPSVDWSDQTNHSCFGYYLSKVTRLMHKLTAEPHGTRNIWPCLIAILTGISECIENLQLAHAHSSAIVNLIDTILNINIIIQAGSLILSQGEDNEIIERARNALEFLKMMPSDFSRSFVRLCKTYLVVSSANPGNRYYIRNIFQEKVRVPNEVAKALIIRKLLIPLMIAIGEEQDYALDISDLDFLVEALKNYSKDIIQVMTSGQSYPLQDTFRAFFLGIKVMCTTFHDTLTTQHWVGVTQIITSIGSREKVLKKNEGRILYEDLSLYYKELLVFIEEYVLVYFSPLRIYFWPVLDTVEDGLNALKVHLASVHDNMRQFSVSGRQPFGAADKSVDDVEEQLTIVDVNMQVCQRIKDSFLEEYEHKAVAELLEGFDTELHGGLFKVSDTLETRSRRKPPRMSISDYLSKTKRQIFSTLGSSSFSESKDLYQIQEEEEDGGLEGNSKTHSTEELSSKRPSSKSTMITNVLYDDGDHYKQNTKQSKPPGEVLSSDSEEETFRPATVDKYPKSKFARRGIRKVYKDCSYEADNELQSPLTNQATTFPISRQVEVEIHGSISSLSSEASTLPNSRKTSLADQKAEKKRSSSTTESSNSRSDGKQSQMRKISDSTQPAQSHLQPLQPAQRGSSPILISHRASPTSTNNRRQNLRKSQAIEDSAILNDQPSRPNTEPLLELSNSSQRQPLLPNSQPESNDTEQQFHEVLFLADVIGQDV